MADVEAQSASPGWKLSTRAVRLRRRSEPSIARYVPSSRQRQISAEVATVTPVRARLALSLAVRAPRRVKNRRLLLIVADAAHLIGDPGEEGYLVRRHMGSRFRPHVADRLDLALCAIAIISWPNATPSISYRSLILRPICSGSTCASTVPSERAQKTYRSWSRNPSAPD